MLQYRHGSLYICAGRSRRRTWSFSAPFIVRVENNTSSYPVYRKGEADVQLPLSRCHGRLPTFRRQSRSLSRRAYNIGRVVLERRAKTPLYVTVASSQLFG